MHRCFRCCGRQSGSTESRRITMIIRLIQPLLSLHSLQYWCTNEQLLETYHAMSEGRVMFIEWNALLCEGPWLTGTNTHCTPFTWRQCLFAWKKYLQTRQLKWLVASTCDRNLWSRSFTAIASRSLEYRTDINIACMVQVPLFQTIWKFEVTERIFCVVLWCWVWSCCVPTGQVGCVDIPGRLRQ